MEDGPHKEPCKNSVYLQHNLTLIPRLVVFLLAFIPSYERFNCGFQYFIVNLFYDYISVWKVSLQMLPSLLGLHRWQILLILQVLLLNALTSTSTDTDTRKHSRVFDKVL